MAVDGGRATLTDSGRHFLERGAEAHPAPAPADDRLASFVQRLELELPHFPTPYGPADGSITGGTPHGQDWRPRPRAAGAATTTDGLPRAALLSQLVVQCAIDLDDASRREVGAGSGVSASTSAMLALIEPDGVPLELLPRTRAWPDWFVQHGLAVVEPDPDRPRKKRIRRTDDGDALHAANARRRGGVEETWRIRYGDAAVDDLVDALEALPRDPDDADLVDDVIVVFVGGAGFVVVPPLSPA